MRSDRGLPPSVGDVLGQILQRRRGLRSKLKREELFVRWPEIVGRGLAERIYPLALKGKTLVLGAASSSWAQEAALLNSEILERIESHLGDGVVDQLRVRVSKPTEAGQELETQLRGPGEGGLPEAPKFLEPAEDLDLQERLERLQHADQKLKKWRREKGWPECEECGQLFPPELDDDMCPGCRRRHQQEIQMQVRVLLEDAPWLSVNQMVRETGADRKCCRRVRGEVTAYWRARVDEGVRHAEATGRILPDFRRRVLQLMMAEAGGSRPELNPSAVGNVCGSDASELFFDGDQRRG